MAEPEDVTESTASEAIAEEKKVDMSDEPHVSAPDTTPASQEAPEKNADETAQGTRDDNANNADGGSENSVLRPQPSEGAASVLSEPPEVRQDAEGAAMGAQKAPSLEAAFELFAAATRGDTVRTQFGKFKIPGTADGLAGIAKKPKNGGGLKGYASATADDDTASDTLRASRVSTEPSMQRAASSDNILFLDDTRTRELSKTDGGSTAGVLSPPKFVPSTTNKIRLAGGDAGGPVMEADHAPDQDDDDDVPGPLTRSQSDGDIANYKHEEIEPSNTPNSSPSAARKGKKSRWRRLKSKIKKYYKARRCGPETRTPSPSKKRSRTRSKSEAILGDSVSSARDSAGTHGTADTDTNGSSDVFSARGSIEKKPFGSVHRANPIFDDDATTQVSPSLATTVEDVEDDGNGGESDGKKDNNDTDHGRDGVDGESKEAPDANDVSPVPTIVEDDDSDDDAKDTTGTPESKEAASKLETPTQSYTVADLDAVKSAQKLDSGASRFRARLSTRQSKRKPTVSTLGRRATNARAAAQSARAAVAKAAQDGDGNGEGTTNTAYTTVDDGNDDDSAVGSPPPQDPSAVTTSDVDDASGSGNTMIATDERPRAQTSAAALDHGGGGGGGDGHPDVVRRRVTGLPPHMGGGINRNRPMSSLMAANKQVHRQSMNIAMELNSILGARGRGRGGGRGGRHNKALAKFANEAKSVMSPSQGPAVVAARSVFEEETTPAEDSDKEADGTPDDTAEVAENTEDNDDKASAPRRRKLPQPPQMSFMSEMNAKLGIKKTVTAASPLATPSASTTASGNAVESEENTSSTDGCMAASEGAVSKLTITVDDVASGDSSEGKDEDTAAPSIANDAGTTKTLRSPPSTDVAHVPPPGDTGVGSPSKPLSSSLAPDFDVSKIGRGGKGNFSREFTARTAAGIAFIEQQRKLHAEQDARMKAKVLDAKAGAGAGVDGVDDASARNGVDVGHDGDDSKDPVLHDVNGDVEQKSARMSVDMETLPRPQTALHMIGTDMNADMPPSTSRNSKLKALRSRSKSASPDQDAPEQMRQRNEAEELASKLEVENLMSESPEKRRMNMSLVIEEEEEPDEEDE